MKKAIAVPLLVLLVAALLAPVAAAADPVYNMVGEPFDSSSPFLDTSNYVRDPPYNNTALNAASKASVAPKQADLGSAFYGYDPTMFNSPPLKGIYTGAPTGSGQQTFTWVSGTGLVTSASWVVNLDEYDLTPGDECRFSVGKLVASMYYDNFGGTSAFVRVAISLMDGVNVLDSSILVEEEFPGLLLGLLSVATYGAEEMVYDFQAPAAADCTLQFTVEYWNTRFLPDPYPVTSPLNASKWWFAFTGAALYSASAPDPDEEFKEEQRGFWAKILQFLQDIWDAIMSIPEAIANFFKQIWDVLRMIFEWILAIVRLLVKAINFFTVALGFLPWWIYVGAIALVAICVIYKILGRESTG